MVRGLSVVALVVGLVLGGLGVRSLVVAADDRNEADALSAEADERSAEAEQLRTDQAALVEEIEAAQSEVEALAEAVDDLDQGQREVVMATNGIEVFDDAVAVWNTGDHGGAVAIVDATVPASIAELDRRLRDIATAEREVRHGTRTMPRVRP
jgi:outer membrane murein-binding lipoprotein Lpp